MFDVLIMGAGFAGLATAYDLSRQYPAFKIGLFEKEAAIGLHASGKNAGMFRQAVPMVKTAHDIQQTKTQWQDWTTGQTWPTWFEPTGSLLLGEAKQLSRLQKNLVEAGGTAELFLAEKWPAHISQDLITTLSTNPNTAVLYTPEDGLVNVADYLQDLWQRVRAQGVELHFATEIKGLHWQQDHWEVKHTKGIAHAGVVVNAAGAWATEVALKAGLSAPELTSYRRHLLATESSPININTQTWPIVWDVEDGVYFRPFQKGLMLSPGDEIPHPVMDPPVDPQIEKLLQKKMKKSFPDFKWDAAYQKIWACLRTKSQNNEILIGPDPAQKSFVWAAALGGHGLSASLGVGQRVAQQVIQILK